LVEKDGCEEERVKGELVFLAIFFQSFVFKR
jgi:hypothetical protein